LVYGALLRQQRAASVRGKPDDLEAVAVPRNDVQYVPADRPRRPEDDDPFDVLVEGQRVTYLKITNLRM
jgi:hypothetical protein